MAKYLKALAGAALLLACTGASAQLPKGNGGAEYNAMTKKELNVPELLRDYIGVAQGLLNAEKEMLSAVGLSEPAARAGTEAQALGPASTRSQFENALKVQADSLQALRQKLDSKPALDDATRQQFANGLGELSRGWMSNAELSRTLVENRKILKADGAIGAAALYLSKALPGTSRELGQTLQAAAAYAKANNITLPQATNEALNQM